MQTLPVSAERPRGFGVLGLAAGAAAPLEGLRYLSAHPRLWRYAVAPILLNLVITLLVVAALIWGGLTAVEYVQQQFAPGWAGQVARAVSLVLLLVVIAGMAVGAWLLLGGILCGHFYGRLAMQVERALGTPEEQLTELSIYYQTVDVLRDFAALAVVNLGCLVLALVPVIGTVVGGAIALYFDCMIFGVEYLDFPLALRGWRRAEKWRFARQHRFHTLGLGGTVLVLNFLPILGSIFLAGAAVGGVLLYHRLNGTLAARPQ